MTNPPRPRIQILESRPALGMAAARRFQRLIAECLERQPRCRVIFGCAPSQDEFFSALVREATQQPELWRQVEVFHMDEYVGLPALSPENFRSYLRDHFLAHVATGPRHLIEGEAADPVAEAARYAGLIAGAPIDIIAMGIGENGHVAFNDPPVADFADPVLVKVVELDEVCRQQQVNDDCFPALAEVPRSAITITVPVFMSAARLCAVVPGSRKAAAVRAALLGPIGPGCPATIMRQHSQAELFLEPESAALYLKDTKAPPAN